MTMVVHGYDRAAFGYLLKIQSWINLDIFSPPTNAGQALAGSTDLVEDSCRALSHLAPHLDQPALVHLLPQVVLTPGAISK